MTLHEQLVEAFEDCDNEGRALHGCYASAAKEVFKKWSQAQAKKRGTRLENRVKKNKSLNQWK